MGGRWDGGRLCRLFPHTPGGGCSGEMVRRRRGEKRERSNGWKVVKGRRNE